MQGITNYRQDGGAESGRALRYVLATAARNEESFIEKTIESVVAQTIQPTKWVIVSDGSTDRTDEIVRRYADRYTFITCLRRDNREGRNFGSQVDAINCGIAELHALSYDYIGNLDADVAFEPGYFEALLAHFEEDALLGLAGGYIYDRARKDVFQCRRSNRRRSVAHAVQLFRRRCFEVVGNQYIRLPYGGPDSYAETAAQMAGWSVRAYPDLKVRHYRPSGSAGGALRSAFRMGRMDYTLGYLPAYEICKALWRLPERPIAIGAAARLAGFAFCYCTREKRHVPAQFMKYLRDEQWKRLLHART